MAAGSIVVDLLLKTGTFETDTKRASKTFQKEFRDMQRSFKEFAGVLGTYLSAGALKDFVKGTIDAQDHLNDLSKKTGIAAETLGGIGFAAQQSGGDLDSVSLAAGKLNKSLAEAASGNEQAAEAFKVLGIEVKDAAGRTKTADVVMAELADKFASFHDGPEKAALALRIFGKTGADIIPLLDEGGKSLRDNIDYFKRYSGVTKETAEAADKFNDTLAKINLLSGAFGKTLVAELLPSLQNLADLFLENKEKGDQMRGVASDLADLLKTLAFGAVAAGLGFQAFGKALGGLAAGVLAFRENRFADAIEIGKETLSDLGIAKDRITDIYDAIFTGQKKTQGLGDPIKAALYGAKGYGDTKILKNAPRLGSGNPTTPKDDFGPLIKRITEMRGEAQLLLDAEGELTDAQKLGAKIAADYAEGLIAISPAQLALIDSTLKSVDAIQKAIKAKEDDIRWTREATDANASFVESQMHVRDSYIEQAKAARIEIDAFGLSREEVDKLATARMREAAAALDQKAAVAEADGFLGDVSKLYREQATLIRATAAARDFLTQKEHDLHYDSLTGATQAVKDYLDAINRAGDDSYQLVRGAFQSLEDAAVSAFTSGNLKDAAKQMVNQILAEVYRLAVVRPLLNSIFKDAGGLSGILKFFSGGSPNAAGGSAGAGFGSGAGYGNADLGTFLASGTNYVPSDGFQATLHKGEAVVPKAYNPAAGGKASGNTFVQVLPPAGHTAREERSQQGDDQIVKIIVEAAVREVDSRIASGGSTHRVLAGQYGLSRAAGAAKRG